MKIYNVRCNRNTNGPVSGGKDQSTGKGYKSPRKRKSSVNRRGVPGSSGQKTSKKAISTKNRKFLEGLGLKVKQSIENC